LKLFRKVITFILKFRITISIALFSLCAYALFLIFTQLKVDNSLTIWFLEDDKEYLEYLDFQKEQGSDEIIVVMIATENAFSKKHIKTLNSLHQKIDSIKKVNATFSLVKAQYPIFANNKMYLKNVINDKRSERAITNLLKKLPAIRDNLLAENNTKSFFYIQLKSFAEIEENREELLLKIRTTIDSELKDYKITGSPILVQEINNSVAKETLTFAIVTGLIIVLLLLIVLPKINYLPIALAVVVIPITLLFGLHVALGYKLNMISMLIPTILMVYSVSDIIHIINIHYLHVQKYPNQTINEQIIEALYKSLKPCFYTTITTVIGYLALHLSPLPVFKTTGIFSFIGLVIAFVSSYIIAAIGFRILILNRAKKANSYSFNWIDIDLIILKINYVTTHYKKTILIVSSVLFFIGISSVFFIKVNSYSVDLLHKGKAKEDLRDIEKTLKGAFRLSLDISSDDKSSLIDNKTLQLIEKFQTELQQNKELSTSISIIDFKKFIEKRYGIRGSIRNNKIDYSEADKNQFFKLISDDLSRISINVNAISLGSHDLKILLNKIKQSFALVFKNSSNISLKINGSPPLYIQLHDYILITQFRSFSTAFIFSFLILFFFIKKLRTSFLALLPNLLPLLFTAIIMVIFDIPLEASNAMIAPIMLGIAMDDTIHLIHRYKEFKAQGFSVNESMDKAMLYTGRALISTTITLVLGFSVLLFSQLTNMQEFGFLCAVTILFALIADGFILPALIKTFDK